MARTAPKRGAGNRKGANRSRDVLLESTGEAGDGGEGTSVDDVQGVVTRHAQSQHEAMDVEEWQSPSTSRHNAAGSKVIGTVTKVTPKRSKGGGATRTARGRPRRETTSRKRTSSKASDTLDQKQPEVKARSLGDVSDSDAESEHDPVKQREQRVPEPELEHNRIKQEEQKPPETSSHQKPSGHQSRPRSRKSRGRERRSGNGSDSLNRSSSQARRRQSDLRHSQEESRAVARDARLSFAQRSTRRTVSKESQKDASGIEDITQQAPDSPSASSGNCGKWVLLWLLGTIMALFVVFYLQSAVTLEKKVMGGDHFRQQIQTLQRNYPKQSPRFWSTIIVSMNRVLYEADSKYPAVILVGVHKRCHQTVLELLGDLSAAIITSLKQMSNSLLITERDIARLSQQDLHYKLDMSYQSGNKIALLENLAMLPANATPTFYAFADSDTALHKDVALVATVVLQDTLEKPTAHDVEEALAEKWEDSVSNLPALFSRIANNVVIYEPFECSDEH